MRPCVSRKLVDSTLSYWNINKMALSNTSLARRLFAVVHLFGRQRLVTSGDLLAIDADIPLACGQKFLLSKCLVLGGKDFSIIGRPIIDRSSFKIHATVIEKTMTDHRCFFRHKPRNHGIRKFFYQSLPRTIVRINDIELLSLPEH